MSIAGVIVICTGKYDVFIQPLVESLDKFFFKGFDYDLYVFADKVPKLPPCDRRTTHWAEIDHTPFPFATLYRYKHITKYAEWLTAENLYYIDVDMLLVNEVGTEIVADERGLVAVRHPGFFRNDGWGDNGTPVQSTAYLKPSQRHDYFAGGFQGGSNEAYLTACSMMAENIDIDLDTAKDIGWEKNSGILALYHDESHWNHYLKYHPYKELTPSYCMVEEAYLRRKWDIDDIHIKIIALKKDHKQIRS
jgi:histo-blood group ABO system transferase